MSKKVLLEFNSFMEQIDKRFIQNGWIKVHDENIHCGLVIPECTEDILNDCNWDLGYISHGICIYSDGRYQSGYDQKVSPLIYHRDNNEIEIAEEFRLLYNLYRKKTADGFVYYGIDENGDEVEVAHQKGITILIQVKFLKEFIALKKRHLVLFFYVDIEPYKSLKDQEVIRKDDYMYEYWIVPPIGQEEVYSKLMGKCILKYNSKDNKDLWNWWSGGYEDFIIGYSNAGEEVSHTCDKSTLSNMFVSIKDAPLDITPVYFKKQVLDKYYENPTKYKVEDGHVTCIKYWDLRIDNDRQDTVIVLLVDLGKLPHKEQLYWKTYNIAPPLNSDISNTAYNRWMQGQYCDTSEAPDLIFKRELQTFTQNWRNKYNWDLFLPLATGDEHYLVSLHSLTVTDNDSDFENQIRALTKIIVDSINEEKVSNHLDGKNDKGITKLAHWLKIQDVECDEEIKFLRNLQDLRSMYVVHRKSRNDISKEQFFIYFQMDTKNDKEVLDDIFGKMTCILQTLTNKLLVTKKKV